MLDKDLRDDMLKLVRYKILFVRREYEVSFPEREDLVSDNMDGDAFAAWKVAEFIQDLAKGDTPVPPKWAEKRYPSGFVEPADDFEKGALTGLPAEDKKYLRVYFEVLERYPREKFKFEEQQIKVLEEIRDEVGKRNTQRLLPDPFGEFMNRLRLSGDAFQTFRTNFARCADKIGKDMAGIMNQYRKVGQFEAPQVSADEIAGALTSPPPFDRETLDRFTGPTIGSLRVIAPNATGPFADITAPPVYSVWGVQKADNSGEFTAYTQRITGSNYRNIDPNNQLEILEALAETQVDLIFNAWTKDLGFVTWSSYRENHDNQLRSFGYEMNGKILWFNQMLDPDMKLTVGPLPIQPPLIVTSNQLIVSMDFVLEEGRKTYFCVYALHINFDFQKCSAEFAGRILKMKNELIG
jgi:hypothetical protein